MLITPLILLFYCQNIDNIVKFTTIRKPSTLTVKPNKIRNNNNTAFAKVLKLVDKRICEKILKHINEYPGIRHRELLRLTGLSNGVLSFHLKKLKKSKLVKAKKLGYNTTRYYPISVKANESNIFRSSSGFNSRKTILFLLEHSNCRFKEIVHFIDKSRSTTSFQLQRLEHTGIISVLRVDKNNQFYRIEQELSKQSQNTKSQFNVNFPFLLLKRNGN